MYDHEMRQAQRLARTHIADGKRLKYLQTLERLWGRLEMATERRMRRQSYIDRFRRCNQGGRIGVIVSGMDCDCVKYSRGRVVEVTSVADLDDWIKDQLEWADGPMDFAICGPDDADHYKGYSRDLALEAFEDGHPHSIHA